MVKNLTPSSVRSGKKIHYVNYPDADKFVKLEHVPLHVEDRAGKCIYHTMNVIRRRVARRQQHKLNSLRGNTHAHAHAHTDIKKIYTCLYPHTRPLHTRNGAHSYSKRCDTQVHIYAQVRRISIAQFAHLVTK